MPHQYQWTLRYWQIHCDTWISRQPMKHHEILEHYEHLMLVNLTPWAIYWRILYMQYIISWNSASLSFLSCKTVALKDVSPGKWICSSVSHILWNNILQNIHWYPGSSNVHAAKRWDLTAKGYISWYYCVLALLHQIMGISQNNSLLCEGSFAHTYTNTFSKKYHSHLKWVLKGFHSEIMPSSFDQILYLLQTTLHSCKSVWE